LQVAFGTRQFVRLHFKLDHLARRSRVRRNAFGLDLARTSAASLLADQAAGLLHELVQRIARAG